MEVRRRVQRLERQLQQVVAEYLMRGFKASLRGLVSVTRVESNAKLRTAKVYVSILGSAEDQEYNMGCLRDHIFEVQKHVNKELHMKFVPRINFVLDEGLDRLLTVESKLRQIALENEAKISEAESHNTEEN